MKRMEKIKYDSWSIEGTDIVLYLNDEEVERHDGDEIVDTVFPLYERVDEE